jgi:hypothetical protein
MKKMYTQVEPNELKNYGNSIKEEVTGVQLSDEDLRIRLLSDDKLNKEVVVFLMQGSSDEATKLLNRHKELKKKGTIRISRKF